MTAHAENINYLKTTRGLKSWLTTVDHKRIGLMYLASILVFFITGGLYAMLFRLELWSPEKNFLTPDQYNNFFTLHGVVMVWFFLIPSIPNTLGNFLLPLIIGARDDAFPKLNLVSWYLNVGGGLLAHVARVGTHFEARLRAMAGKYPFVKDVRGAGLMWGVELTKDATAVVPLISVTSVFGIAGSALRTPSLPTSSYT